MSKDNFCIAPWLHTHVWPDGSVFPCCTWDNTKGKMGSMKEDSLENIWNSHQYKDLRKQFINNEQPEGCSRCFKLEEQDIKGSYRFHLNDTYKKHFSDVDKTLPDGTLNDMNLRMWDFRLSNYCNFKCRSCGHSLSSSWFEDAKAIGNVQGDKALISINDNVDFLKLLEPHFDCVEEIYFAGGEPLMMEDHYIILEELIKRGRTDVTLRYSTNFSILKFKKWKIIELWENFNNIDLFISVDGFGDIGEYVRKGFNSEKFVSNVTTIMESKVKVKTLIYMITFGTLNFLHLPEMMKAFVEFGLIPKKDRVLKNGAPVKVDVGPIYMPDHYNCVHLPDRYKNKFLNFMENFKQDIIKLGGSEDTASYLYNALMKAHEFSTNGERQKNSIHKLSKITKILDTRRVEKFEDTLWYFDSVEDLYLD